MALACPRCGIPMNVATASGATLHGCGGCGGIWLDMPTAHRVCQVLDGDTRALAESAARYAARAVDTQAQIACPVCGQPLARSRIQNAGVDIDYCGLHGTWFDRDELSRIGQAAAVARAYAAPRPAAAAVAPLPQQSSPDDDEGDSGWSTAGNVGLGVLGFLLDAALDD